MEFKKIKKIFIDNEHITLFIFKFISKPQAKTT